MKYSNAATAHINVFIGCLFASFLFLFIAVLYLFPKISKYIRLTLPDALVGPLISLIGLDLLDTAIEDSGLKAYPLNLNTIFVAAVTLSTIIICTTFKRSFFKNASVVIGVFAGLVTSGVVLHYKPYFSNHIFSSPITAIAELISVTNTSAIHFEEIEWVNIFIAIIPTTVVVFSENITKITLLEKIIRAEKSKEEPVEESAETSSGKNDFENFYQRSILGHAISFLASVMMRSVPNTVYAQNIALMELNNVENYNNIKIEKEKDNHIAEYYNRLSVYPLYITSALFIICSFLTLFQDILSGIPKPVYGGMELFVFSIISAQGVQLLVDRKVNYKKVTNQIITSATLLAGLSTVSINLKVAEISGLSLGLLVGVSLNLIFKVFSYYGKINEKINVIEVLEVCDSVFRNEYEVSVEPVNIEQADLSDYICGKNRMDSILDLVNSITKAEVTVKGAKIAILKEANENIVITVSPYLEEYVKIKNDYRKNVVRKEDSIVITFDEQFSVHKLKSSLKRIKAFSSSD